MFCYVTQDSGALSYPVVGVGMGAVLSLAEVAVTGVFRMQDRVICAFCHRFTPAVVTFSVVLRGILFLRVNRPDIQRTEGPDV